MQARKNRINSTKSGQFQSGLLIFKTNRNTNRNLYQRKKESNIMFRTIRKKKNEISIDTAKALLQSSRRGVLAVNGDDGYPYAIQIGRAHV